MKCCPCSAQDALACRGDAGLDVGRPLDCSFARMEHVRHILDGIPMGETCRRRQVSVFWFHRLVHAHEMEIVVEEKLVGHSFHGTLVSGTCCRRQVSLFWADSCCLVNAYKMGIFAGRVWDSVNVSWVIFDGNHACLKVFFAL